MLRQFANYYRPYKGLFLLDFGCAVIVGDMLKNTDRSA